jgi:hypothetical protein
MEEGIGVMQGEIMEGPGLPPEARKRQRILPLRLQRQHGPANTYISDSRNIKE